MRIYLDNAATTKPLPRVVDKVNQMMLDEYANPSSLHDFGMRAGKEVETARGIIAENLGVEAGGVFFTSGGTESNNIAVLGAISAMRNKGKIITSHLEHKSVLEPIKKSGCEVEFINIRADGTVDISHFESLMSGDIALVSVMHVNNETGAIQPVNEVADIIKRSGSNAILHVDAVQGFCKIPSQNGGSAGIHADLISIGAHKIGGIKGAGALYVKKNVRINPLFHGGGQEQGVRSGTENTPAIAGFGVAASEMGGKIGENYDYVRTLNDYMRRRLLESVDDLVITSPADGSPYILSISVKNVMAEVLLHSLERHKIYISSGSACSSNKPQISETLLAMGVPRELIKGNIRISFSPQNTKEEVETAAQKIAEEVKSLRRIKR